MSDDYAGPSYTLGRVEERQDVLALLERRRCACATMVERNPAEAERAGVMQRQLAVLIDEVRAGLHEGEVAAAQTVGSEES